MVSRRELLGAAGASGIGLLSGCLCVAATSYIPVDDVLRVHADRVRRTDSGYSIRVSVAQPGEDDWSYEHGREADFLTTYEGVTLRAYALDGTELMTVDYGDFEAGQVTSRRIRTDRFPDVLMGTASNVVDEYNGCGVVRQGVEAAGYVGAHSSRETIPESARTNWDSEAHWEIDRSGHRWESLGYEYPHNDRSDVFRPFDRTRCRQHKVAGPYPTGEFFGVVDGRPERLERDDVFEYRWVSQIDEERDGARTVDSATVPDAVFDPGPPFQWELAKDAEDPLTRRISRSTFVAFFEALEGRTAPTLSTASPDVTPRPHWRFSETMGSCDGGLFRARYDFEYEGKRRLIRLEHSWKPIRRAGEER